MTNVVTIELTGDESSLESAIERATRQVQSMDQTVATASSSIEESSGKMERMAERSDRLATSSGTLAGGIGALAGGIALVGLQSDSTAGKILGGVALAIGTLSGVMDICAVASSSATVAMIGQKAALVGSSIATGAATAAQWALNTAQLASPTTWIVLAILALVAVIVVIATKTTWFQDTWRVAWGGIKTAVGAVRDFFVDTVWHGGIEKAFNAIGSGVSTVKGWFTSIPGLISSAFSGLVNIITWPYRTAFNFISDAWNNTVGRLQWTVPSWVPVIGGNTVGAPRLPRFHVGGMVTGGPEGSEVLGIWRVGERVQTREMQAAEAAAPSVTYNITVQGNRFRDGTDFEDWLDDLRNDGRGGGEVTE
jgi:phage-related protein